MNYFYFSTSLSTNFKPSYFNSFDNLIFFKKKKNQIFCKNLFMFLILIKYKKTNFFDKSNIFIKPYKRKVYTILRSPYRHKLARHQIVLNRYNILSSIRLKVDKYFVINNFNDVKKIFYFFKKFNNWFESNIIYNYKINFSFIFTYNSNFLLNKFFRNNNKKK